MTESDLAQTAALWHAGWHDAHAAICPPALTGLRTLASFTDRLNRRIGNSHVAALGNEILGFFTLEEDELYQFYVAPAARGSGLASRLISDAEDALLAAGITQPWLACTVGNDRAARFYEKAGWRRVRTESLPVETSDGPFTLDIWRYEKDLSAEGGVHPA
ncbi:GNAT family N-acetyltransferase [Marimonas arenosa]|uniref:GNAT family N-acetyltransferase n=1 Tax=Marimonas arenosa TaxID=1795305 RepID=A0AAE3WCH6_9RHOB|nr:GNAT family N-acetyltransferase [Marimonas arenosa]MDQ2089963.1 GNAT family N-acetyltransferase [Marimonas arenosa]